MDVEVLSKHCLVCAAHRDMDESSDKFLDWWEKHQASCEANYKGHHQQWSLMEPSTSCKANYNGSSPAMESRGALNIL